MHDSPGTIFRNREQLTENLKFDRKNEVSTIFVSFDMHSEWRISSRTRIVAVAVNAIIGISNSNNFKLQALKFSRKTDNRLKHVETSLKIYW